MSVARQAILQAYIEDVLCELMVKTTGAMVYLNETTTVAAKISEMVTAINARAKSTDVTAEITAAVEALKQELLGDVPVEAYNTFTELAAYISEHQDVSDALTEAIGKKASAEELAAVQAAINGLGSLAAKSKVSESDLDDALLAKVNAASEGNHSHANSAVLDGITAEKVAAWDGKGRFIPSETQPADLAAGDLWAQLV
ncbi:MAG: hypothetical protein IJ347_01175 [Faecalibacterium sp.]|nr:hypothetical protein [Faecalibacterium sp.]